MTAANERMRRSVRARYRACPISRLYLESLIQNLSDFFGVFHSVLGVGEHVYWFRGHACMKYRLAPSALRYASLDERQNALALVEEMKRFLEMKLPRPPASGDTLGWMQVAQHYGLPTRLLDWTQNAAVALFFACCDAPDEDGAVIVMNPLELNQHVDPKRPRIFHPQKDHEVIRPYFELGGKERRNGLSTIALNPTWNSERIAMQQGAFTLHGSRKFDIDEKQVSSLLCVPILREHKMPLLHELQRVGIGEMFIFPEPEHVCAHLKRAAKL